jgi:hypothetical protein
MGDVAGRVRLVSKEHGQSGCGGRAVQWIWLMMMGVVGSGK